MLNGRSRAEQDTVYPAPIGEARNPQSGLLVGLVPAYGRRLIRIRFVLTQLLKLCPSQTEHYLLSMSNSGVTIGTRTIQCSRFTGIISSLSSKRLCPAILLGLLTSIQPIYNHVSLFSGRLLSPSSYFACVPHSFEYC